MGKGVLAMQAINYLIIITVLLLLLILYYYYLWPSAGTFLVCEFRHDTKENNLAQFRCYFKEP